MSAAGVTVSTVPFRGAGAGSTPSAALQSLRVVIISFRIAKEFVRRHHYLGTLPGGTALTFGVFLGDRLMGVVVFGAGPSQVCHLVGGASRANCLGLTRLCLVKELPWNSASRVLAIILRALKRETDLRFLVTYADPAKGHLGIVYQASNWLYIGLSQATPLYSLAGEAPRHSRSFSHAFGTRDVKHFAAHGVSLRKVPQQPKHRYIYFLDPAWRSRLRASVEPYPKLEK